MTITTSIPATSAARPQPDVLGASHTLGSGALVGVGVGIVATVMLTMAPALSRDPSLALYTKLSEP